MKNKSKRVNKPTSDSEISNFNKDKLVPVIPIDPRNVAVVHGRDNELTDAVFTFLRSLDLHPIEWEELVSSSQVATPYTGHLIDRLFSNVQAVVVIFSPDDEAKLHPDLCKEGENVHETKFMCQSRPNVLFEAGMAFGLYPHRTILVEVGELRPVSDLIGRHTVRLGAPTAVKSFVNRLQSAGCSVKTDGTDWLNPLRFKNLYALTRKSTTRIEIKESPSRIFPTNIWLNPWFVAEKKEVEVVVKKEKQKNPVIAATLQRDLSRDNNKFSLYSKKDGPNALLRLKGQVNLQASGSSDFKLLLVQQRFALDGRPLSNPPDAGPFGFPMIPGQEINISFEVSIPDKEYKEGDLLYALHLLYEDEVSNKRELEVFWWYDFVEDKFWNNLNKVPYFDSIKSRFW